MITEVFNCIKHLIINIKTANVAFLYTINVTLLPLCNS
jgi:hypothetical protein